MQYIACHFMFRFSPKQSLSNTQFLIDSIGEGVLIVNADGIISAANTTAEKLLGYAHQEFIGWDCLEPFGALDERGRRITKKNAALLAAIENGKKTIHATRQFFRKEGSRFWASITVTPIREKGKGQGAILVFRDITKEKMDHEYHTDFARVASHQLRTPLGNVLWSAEYILSEKPGKLSKLQRETLEQTYQTLREMNILVNDLLSVSRLQDHEVKARPKKVSLMETLQKVIRDLEPYAKASNVTFALPADNKKHLVMVEPHHLRTILQNLVENAVRYAFPKTSIELTVEKDGKHVLFSCKNKGIGISDKSKKFIFAKFFRAKNAVKKQGDGTGLGLYITHELVTLYNGKIWFDSKENKDTTFYIRF